MSDHQSLSYAVFVSEQVPTGGLLPDGVPRTWSPLSSTLISGDTDALLVDPPFTREQTDLVGDWIEQSGKRLTQIYITHGHGDHWFGAPRLVERFPGVTVYATAGTIAQMHVAGSPEQRSWLWDKLFPDQIGETPVIARPVPADGWNLEGHALEAVEVGHSDGEATTVLHVPSLGLVVAGDVAYNGVHQFLAEGGHGGLDAWLRALDTVRSLNPRAVIAGHKNPKLPDDPRILDQTSDYLRTAQRLLAQGLSAETFIEQLLSSYPDRLNATTAYLGVPLLLRSESAAPA
ncbi:MBL fold metallo-hydrolase [Nocardia sp. NPDC051756]|uniref:MBL fold metallo-hydrolase n=1 Tax=Nocardia sp. NPDC051756 TaxID=3154751 RepID=UPI00341CB4D0